MRKAYLCGADIITNESYEHRRGGMRIKQTQIFTIDIAAYGIMSNHYHVVLHINKEIANNWSFDEVIDRWHQLYKGNVLSQRFRARIALSDAELDKLYEYVELWHERLMDISWFMHRLNRGCK
ncbi:MAG: hypothetical protein ACI8SR_001344 [Oceanicoccus sp.]